MPKSGNQVYIYADPDPFTTPTVEERQQQFDQPFLQLLAQLLPPEILPHEQLMYSAPIIENLMFTLNREFEFRGVSNRQWKLYKSAEDDFDVFVPTGNTNGVLRGSRLSEFPVKWFPLYVRDMQEAIVELTTLGGVPDDIGSAMARIFGNLTTAYGSRWSGRNVIRPSYILPRAADDTSSSNVTTFDVDLSSFPFPFDSQAVKAAGSRMGIDFKGEAYVNRGTTGIQISDDDWPRSVIGKTRIEEDVTIKEGSLIEEDGKQVEGIDGVHVPMKAAGRQDHNRVIDGGTGDGFEDVESGYGWFCHHPLVLHQCRYQPPSVETWDNKTPIRDYVENVFSNQTPNLPWYFSQPVERQHGGDWGGWIIQGFGGLDDGIFAEAYPDGQHSSPVTNCPFPVFYPPSEGTCTCSDSNGAYAIWNSKEEPLIWNLRTWFNFGAISAAKLFGPKTRMRVSGDIILGAGVGGSASFSVSIRTTRISTTNLQPFVGIINLGAGGTGSLDVNIMERMAEIYPFYEVAGLDSIRAILISVNTSTFIQQVVQAVDGPTGTFLPNTQLGCQVGTSSFDLDYLQLYEPPLTFGDVRLPAPDIQTLTPPPSYPYPILSGGPEV